VQGRRINRILIQKPPHRRTEPSSREISSPIAVGPSTRAGRKATGCASNMPALSAHAPLVRDRRRSPNTLPRNLNPPQHLSRRNLLLLLFHNLTQDTRTG
jgi:hypothetical protein